MNSKFFGFFICIVHALKIHGLVSINTDSVFFRVYKGNSVYEYVDVPVNRSKSLLRFLNPQKITVFYIHGFNESVESNSVTLIANAHLQHGSYNIIAVDYSFLAANNYVLAAISSSHVGNQIAASLNGLVQTGWRPNKLHVIGHSLGAHVCGFLGRKVTFRIPRITGLDPAGPLFNTFGRPLTAADAKFVDIIHTDMKYYGISSPTGHVDFFPNDGTRIQPGCPKNPVFYSDDDFCSHHRSFTFYAESLIRNSFLASNCRTFKQFKFGECNKNTKVLMGYSTPHYTRGIYFLVTARETPFGLGAIGATNFG